MPASRRMHIVSTLIGPHAIRVGACRQPGGLARPTPAHGGGPAYSVAQRSARGTNHAANAEQSEHGSVRQQRLIRYEHKRKATTRRTRGWWGGGAAAAAVVAESRPPGWLCGEPTRASDATRNRFNTRGLKIKGQFKGWAETRLVTRGAAGWRRRQQNTTVQKARARPCVRLRVLAAGKRGRGPHGGACVCLYVWARARGTHVHA